MLLEPETNLIIKLMFFIKTKDSNFGFQKQRQT